jgi:hypothetical protein
LQQGIFEGAQDLSDESMIAQTDISRNSRTGGEVVSDLGIAERFLSIPNPPVREVKTPEKVKLVILGHSKHDCFDVLKIQGVHQLLEASHSDEFYELQHFREFPRFRFFRSFVSHVALLRALKMESRESEDMTPLEILRCISEPDRPASSMISCAVPGQLTEFWSMRWELSQLVRSQSEMTAVALLVPLMLEANCDPHEFERENDLTVFKRYLDIQTNKQLAQIDEDLSEWRYEVFSEALVGAVGLRIYNLLNSVCFRDPAMLRLAFPQYFDEFDIHKLRNILPYRTYLLLELSIENGITRLVRAKSSSA